MDPEVPGSSPEWVPIFYEARSTAQGLPEHSSLRGSTLGTSPVEHQDSDWVGVNRIDSCNFELCSQGQLCITINSTVFKDGLGSYVK